MVLKTIRKCRTFQHIFEQNSMAPNLPSSRKKSPAMDNREAVQRMRKDFQFRFSALVLAFVTLAAVIFAAINIWKENQNPLPEDGVWWLERGNVVQAERVTPGGVGDNAGIKPGDQLISVEDHEIKTVPGLTRQFYRLGIWSKANYEIERKGARAVIQVILVPADQGHYVGLRLIALIYLGIGIYVLLRRWTAPKSRHFYIFCLVSGISFSFKYTGKLNDVD